MTDEEKREELTKLAESKYFDYLIEKQIKSKVSDFARQRKWVIVAFGAIVSFFLGYNIYSINDLNKNYKAIASQFDNLKTDMQQFEQQANDIIEKSNHQFDILKNQVQVVNDVIENLRTVREDEKDVYQETREILKSQLDLVSNESERIFDRNEAFEKSLSKLEQANQVKLDQLKTFEDSINDRLNALDSLMLENQIVSSTRYLFLERGDRNVGEFEYRPATLNLPFSNCKLTAVFHDQKSFKEEVFTSARNKTFKKEIKEAMVDIVLEDNQNTRKASYVLREQTPQVIPGTSYYIEASFIYLPPNPLVRIPDFIILKVYMQKG